MTRTHMHAFANCSPDTLDRLARILEGIEADAAAADLWTPPPSPWDDMADAQIVATCRGER